MNNKITENIKCFDECNWLFKYAGNDARGLTSLIYINTVATRMFSKYKQINSVIQYYSFRKDITPLKHATNNRCKKMITMAVEYATGFTDLICLTNIKNTEVDIKCSNEFIKRCNCKDENCFYFNFEDIISLTTVNSIKLYMLYKRYYNKLKYIKFRDSEITEIFGNNVNLRKNMYRAVRTANDHIGSIGIRYRLEKCGNIWKFVSA